MTTQVFQLPDLGEGPRNELVQWLVAVGDTITVDRPIAEVETAKALVEVLPWPARSKHCTPGDTLHGQSTDHNCLTTDDDASIRCLDYREEDAPQSQSLKIVTTGLPGMCSRLRYLRVPPRDASIQTTPGPGNGTRLPADLGCCQHPG